MHSRLLATFVRGAAALLAAALTLFSSTGCHFREYSRGLTGEERDVLIQFIREFSNLRRPGAPAAGGQMVLASINQSARVFFTDETGPWGAVDLKPYLGGGSVYCGLVTGSQLVVGTDQGIGWVSMLDGTWGHYSGVPTSYVVALGDNGKGGVLAGVYDSYTAGPPSVYLCDPSTHACAPSHAGMTSDQYSAPIGAFASLSGTIFASTWFGNGVFRSSDGGASWTPCRSGLPDSALNHRIAAAGSSLLLATTSGLYVSTDSGGSWTKATGLPGGDVTGVGGDASAAYAAVNAASHAATAAVYKSTDGGGTWQAAGAIGASTVNAVTIGQLGVYLSTNGGTLRSTDGGATWSPFNEGKDTASVLALASTGDAAVAGTQGNLGGAYRSTDAGTTWDPATGIANRVVSALAANGSLVVASGQDGTFRSTDGGATWGSAGSRTFASLVFSGGAFYGGYGFSGSAIVSVYKSTDGLTWTPANGGTPTTTGATALAAADGVLYAGIGPTVYRSTDGGASWTAGGTVWAADTTYSISCLAATGGVLYAGLTGFGSAPETYGFSKSLDGGVTWIPIRSGLHDNAYAFALAAAGSTLFGGTQRGLFRSTDGGGSWTVFDEELSETSVTALLVTGSHLLAGTVGRGVRVYDVPATTRRLVPIVLDVDTGAAHYTTELALTNRGTTDAAVTLLYTPSLGAGGGSVAESLPAGKQLVIADAIAYLRGKGLGIPASGSQAGTLLLTFTGASFPAAVAVTARTATATAAPQPVGRAGLAYAALDPERDGVSGSLTVYGLRSNASDRSNLAVVNTGPDPVTLAVTVRSGAGDGASFVVAAADTIPAWGWKQYNGVLATAGFASGWATVRRVSTAGTFSAYGVVNDNGTSDGSYVLPTLANTGLDYLNVPVLVETGSFVSELTLANSGDTTATLTLTYTESLTPGAGAGGSVAVTLAPGTQRIIPGAIAFLRQGGAAVGPAGGSYAGSLHVKVSGALVNDVFAGARTASPSPAGGQFGLFTPAVAPGGEALDQAFLYGLRADGTNRSNVAVANTGASPAAGAIALELQAYDGDAGGVPRGAPQTVILQPGQWAQAAGFLGAQGVANGWVKVTRKVGIAPWIAYGVVNDGAGPGQRTGDGAYVPMVK